MECFLQRRPFAAAHGYVSRIHKVSATREAWCVEEEEGLDLWGNLRGEWQ